jgi:hypothetical protein
MKNKLLIVILIATTMALGSYLVYRNQKHGKEANRQQQETRNRMVDLAKKSPKSGLAQMARAVNRYYADNKSYPPDLKSLFPKYIKTEAFIDDIDWSYKPSGNGFLLGKSITKNGKHLTASIDDSLRFKTDKEIMLASRSPEGASEQKQSTVVSRTNENAPSMIPRVNETNGDAQALIRSNTQAQSAKEAMDMSGVKKQPETSVESDEEEKITQPPPEQNELALIAKVSESSKRTELIAEAGNRYLVWIGKDGNIGFSNVQYPDSEKIGYYYLAGKWEPAIR